MNIEPLWSDSLGAKSFSIYISLGGRRIIIDPGVAVMQSSYPGGRDRLFKWYKEAYEKIKTYLRASDIVIITHYHHDHYLWRRDDIPLYREKTLLIKDPNQYINDSQWERARDFIHLYAEEILNMDKIDLLSTQSKNYFQDYVETYKLALSRDFGAYNERRRYLLERGRRWFKERQKKWLSRNWLKEIEVNDNKILFIDNRSIEFGDLKIRFSHPLYHGIEYSKTGWVIGFVIEYLRRKVIYTSDIQGPVIEDYAAWMVMEDPEIIFLDGPPTYLIPYMFNLVNFKRTIENIKYVIRESRSLKIIIYDHHLTRDINFKNKVEDIYEYAKEYGVELLDVATYLGREPAYSTVKKIL